MFVRVRLAAVVVRVRVIVIVVDPRVVVRVPVDRSVDVLVDVPVRDVLRVFEDRE